MRRYVEIAFPSKQSPLGSAKCFLLNETTKYFNFQFVRENYLLSLTGLFSPQSYNSWENAFVRCLNQSPVLGTSFRDGRSHAGAFARGCSQTPAMRAEGDRMGHREKLSWDAVAEEASANTTGRQEVAMALHRPRWRQGCQAFVSSQRPIPGCHWNLAVTLTKVAPFGQGPFLSGTHWWVPLQRSEPSLLTAWAMNAFVLKGRPLDPLQFTPRALQIQFLCRVISSHLRIPPCDSGWSLFLGKLRSGRLLGCITVAPAATAGTAISLFNSPF